MRALLLILAATLFASVPAVQAQESVSVSVTPPLIQLTIGPGETWSSALKVVNNNDTDITYYANLMDFEARGEEGQGTFIPRVASGVPQGPVGYSLASWITMASSSVVIPAGASGEFPFTIVVPPDAEPGGHYAAILVGTQPGDIDTLGPTMRVSSYVSSLVFVRIRGEAIESGRIREFRTERTIHDAPHAEFLLRFENTGTTHLKPEGDITIYNMWGTERGTVAVNQERAFGNVLPKSTRRFTFSWEGGEGPSDIGRYKAVVTLGFGDEQKHNISATTYFWIVPTVPVAVTLGTILFTILSIVWFIRRYVRRALSLERERLGLSPHAPVEPATSIAVLMEPLREGVVDLRRVTQAPAAVRAEEGRPAVSYEPISFGGFLMKYRLFFAFIVLLAAAISALAWFARTGQAPEHSFQVSDVRIEEEAPENPAR